MESIRYVNKKSINRMSSDTPLTIEVDIVLECFLAEIWGLFGSK